MRWPACRTSAGAQPLIRLAPINLTEDGHPVITGYGFPMSDSAIRRATVADVPAIVALLADDALGATRESPDDPRPYEAAFAEIDRDSQHLLLVADRAGAVIGTAQLTFLPG